MRVQVFVCMFVCVYTWVVRVRLKSKVEVKVYVKLLVVLLDIVYSLNKRCRCKYEQVSKNKEKPIIGAIERSEGQLVSGQVSKVEIQ